MREHTGAIRFFLLSIATEICYTNTRLTQVGRLNFFFCLFVSQLTCCCSFQRANSTFIRSLFFSLQSAFRYWCCWLFLSCNDFQFKSVLLEFSWGCKKNFTFIRRHPRSFDLVFVFEFSIILSRISMPHLKMHFLCLRLRLRTQSFSFFFLLACSHASCHYFKIAQKI